MERKESYLVELTTRDQHGNVTRIRAVRFRGLLALAHEDGLRLVRTKLVQVPSNENGKTAIARATVRTRRGTFTGIGDASPANVDAQITLHVIRMAETRAVARALRLAVNIGEVAVEELAEASLVEARRPEPVLAAPEQPRAESNDGDPRPERFRGRDKHPTEAAQGDRRAMSEEQRKLLFRLAFSLGEGRETAADRVLRALGVERFEWATRRDASLAIDALKREATSSNGQRPTNGAAHGA